MFVLEKILRGLTEEESSKTFFPQISIYEELTAKVGQLRNNGALNKIDSEYYEKLRMLVDPILIKAAKRIFEETCAAMFEDDLKIVMYSHDLKFSIPYEDKIDWIGVIKQLMDEIEGKKGLMIRVLRYLKSRSRSLNLDSKMETVSLLLMNTLNKMLSSNCGNIMFALQVLNIIELHVGDGIIEPNLLSILRSKVVNDRIKALTVKILMKMKVDRGDIMRMLELDIDGVGNKRCNCSAVIAAELGILKSEMISVPRSSSKLLNLLNGNDQI